MISQTEIIEVLKMQSILNGSICLLVALAFSCGIFGAYTLVRHGLKADDADTKRWVVGIGVFLGALSIAGFFVFSWLGITKVANPGMSAIDYIVKSTKGSLF